MSFLNTSFVSARRRRFLFLPAGLSVWALVVFWLSASDGVQAQEADLPTGEAIIEQYIEATGGKATRKSIHNRVTKGRFEIVGMGIEAPVTTYAAAPDKSYFLMESPSMGKYESGFDGEVAWEINTMQGARIKKGEERALAVREGTFYAELHWRELYEKAECVGVESVNDRPCYKVVMTPKEGKPETRYYDKETHLLVKLTMTAPTPMGDIPVEATPGDYKEVDGILIPHRAESMVFGQKRILVSESIEHNVEIPADRFELPEEVKVLLKKKGGLPGAEENVEKAEG